MKRRGYVIEQICEMDNFHLAALKARRGKSAKREVIDFFVHSQFNLLSLRESILNGQLPKFEYRRFTIFDPKKRQICSTPFSQRVLQHALMNVCHVDFERYQTDDSYASRIGRGTYKALNKAISNHQKYRFCLKLDIRKFFDSIHHDILKKQLFRLYKDQRLLSIFYKIIDSYEVEYNRGLPIGNLTSQYFANHYLAVVDHWVREKLRVKAYVRYMDDMILWDNDLNKLKKLGNEIKSFIEKQLLLNLKVFDLKPTSRYCTFLGYRISSHRQLLSRRSVDRYRSRLRLLYYQYNLGIIDEISINASLLSMSGFMMHVNSNRQRQKVINSLGG